jgi:hypothetical protein
MHPWSVIRMRARGHSPPARILARAAHATDVVVACVHRFEQPADFLRRILQVGVQRHHAFAAHPLESGDDRHVLAVIGVEQHDPRHVRPRQELVFQQRCRAIAAAVVDEDHFVTDMQRVERRIQAREERGQAGFLVVDRDDDG